MGPPAVTGSDRVAPPGRGRAIGVNLASLVGGDFVNRLFRFGAMVVLARSLPLDEFGALNTAIAMAGVIAVVATAGLTDLGTREVAVAPALAPQLAARVMAVRLVVLAASIATALAIIAVIGGMDANLALAAAAMALAMTVASDWVLRGQERMGVLGIAWALGGAAVAASAIAVAAASGSVAAAMWGYAVGEAVIVLVGWIALRSDIRPGVRFDDLLPLARRALPLAISGAIVYAYTANVDTILLTALRSTAEAGLYSAPYRVFWVLSAVVIFAGYSALPRLSRKSVAGQEAQVASAAALLGWALCCYASVASGLAVIVGGAGLNLVFGSEFREMKEEFTVLVAALSWYAIGFPAGQSLVASGKNLDFLKGATAAGIGNIGLCLLLIPSMGPMGAAVATTAGFALGSGVWLALRRPARRSLQRLVLGALAITGASALAAAAPATAPAVGVLLLFAGAAAAALTRKELTAAW